MSLEDAIINDDIDAIATYSIQQLFHFHHTTYGNVFLTALHYGSLGTIHKLHHLLKQELTPECYQQLLQGQDALGRGAVRIALDKDNGVLVDYLHQQLQYPLTSHHLHYAVLHQSLKAQCHLMQWDVPMAPETQTLFYTPANFIRMLKTQQYFLFSTLLNGVLALGSGPEQQRYLTVHDESGKNALMLAAALYDTRSLQARLDSEKILLDLLALDFEVHTVTPNGRSALSYLIANDAHPTLVKKLVSKMVYLNPHDTQLLKGYKTQFPLSTVRERTAIGEILTNPKSNPKKGRTPKAIRQEVSRSARSFGGERERQLLKQVATQLYLSLPRPTPSPFTTSPFKLEEVQLLHVQWGEVSRLFVAVNQYPMMHSLVDRIKKIGFEAAVTQRHPVPNGPGALEGRRRSARYALKLQARIYGKQGVHLPLPQFMDDFLRASSVTEVLRQANVYQSVMTHPNFFASRVENILLHGESGIYFMIYNGSWGTLKHAEEFLVDIADAARRLGQRENTPVYTCISGKKRPCMGCFGRMQGRIDTFGERPGRFWLNSLTYQPQEAALRTIDVLLTHNVHVTRAVNGTEAAQYDSGSDSEAADSDLSEVGLTLKGLKISS